MFFSIFMCVYLGFFPIFLCVNMVYSFHIAHIHYKNLFFTGIFISPPKNVESILLAVNDTVGRVNDVYLLLDASILKFLENQQIIVSSPNWINYILLGLSTSICIYVNISTFKRVNVFKLTISRKVDVECPICLESPCNVVVKKCRHAFHSKCIDRWFLKKPVCPLCKTSVV